MTLVLQERHSCILVCGGNANSRSMLKKLFHTLPARQGYKLMLASNGYLKKKRGAPLAGLLAPAINLGLACHHRLKWLKLASPEGVDIRTIGSIDELIELLPATPGLLGAVKVYRSAKYLGWRYRDNPRASFLVKGAFRENQLLAYAIYSLDANAEKETINLGRIVDWDIFTTETPSAILSSLYLEVIRHSRRSGAEQIFMTLNDKISAEAAEKSGFVLRDPNSELFVYCKDAQPDDPIFSPELWYQSISDSDADGI